MNTGVQLATKGRRRKSGDRFPSGKLKQRPDRGSERAKRAREYLANGQTPELGTYPLGIMYANNDICRGRWEAGCKYARLFALVYGRPSFAAIAWDAHRGAALGLSGKATPEQRQSLMDAQQRLFRASRAIKDAVDNVAIYESMPRCLKPVISSDSDIREGRRIVTGLSLLAEHFGIRTDEDGTTS